MFKKICAFFLSVLLVLNMVPVTVLAAAGADGSVSIRADKTQVSPGEEFDIYIGVNAKTDNLGSINFTVNMPEGLEYVSHEILVTMTDFMMSNYNPNTGVFGCAVTMTGKGGEFDVLKITVKAKDGAIGTQEFSVTLGTMGKLDGSTKMDYGTVEPVTINVSNYISQFNFVLPDEVDSVPAPVLGAKPVTESGHFGFEELGDGVMYADYYISTADNSVVYEFEPGTTYVEKVEITLFDGYSADANTKLPAYLEGFVFDEENSTGNTYIYTRITAFDTVTVEEVTIDGTVEIPAAFEPMNKAEFTVSVPTSSAYYTFLEIKDGVSKEIEFPTDETYKPGYDYSQNITITLKDGYVFKEGFSAEDVILGEEFKDFVVTIYPTAITLNRYTNVEATISSIDIEGITGRPTLGEYYNPTVTTTTAGAAIEAYYMNGDAFAGEKITDGVYSEEIRIVAEEGYIIDPNVVINGADGFTIAQQTHRAIVLTRDTWVEKTEVAEVNFENFEVPATGEKAVYPVCSDDRFETTVRIYDQNNAVINPGDTYLGNTTYFVEVTLELTEESKGIYKFGSNTQVSEGFAVDGDGTNYIVCTYMVDTDPAVLTGITVTGTPKTAYVYGENFDATGLTVTANYNDGTTKEVTDYTVETKLVPGVTEVTVSYDGKTAVIGGISVAKKELAITGIEAADRVYNGTTKVAVTGGELVGVIPGDDVYVTMPSKGTVATANAGENKLVVVAKPELMGTQADYYTLTEISGVSVNITAKPLAANMAENPADVTYSGKEQKPAVTVKDGEVLLIEGKDYNVVYKDNINIGTAEAVITGIGNYSGSVTKYFVIMQRNISVLLTANDKVYDGTNS
ncbi:MAG: bacterial Ig-like domain-containing protein, partial [Oscillospiraceae bacterium]|nr:bacterial Ig-like domain-containing protein [Oscillospiraceae bacterium]